MKKKITDLRSEIDSYQELTAPLSIDPILDGGIKESILDTLNNKATSTPILKLAAAPHADSPDPAIGNTGEFYIQELATCLLFVKAAGVWSPMDKANDMHFYFDNSGVRYYYSFDDDLTHPVLIETLDLGGSIDSSVKYTAQTLTSPQKEQARTNIDAASKAYIDNVIASLKNSGAIGSSVAGSVMPWFGTVASVPQDWAIIPAAQTWYSKAEFNDLYKALGSESNVWGLTTENFSIPYFSQGSFLVNGGNTPFSVGTKGGEAFVKLTAGQSGLPAHSHTYPIYSSGQHGLQNGVSANQGSTTPSNTLTTSIVPAQDAEMYHNNMPPYVSVRWIIKLKNTGGSFTAAINSEGHLILTFADGTTQDCGDVTGSSTAGGAGNVPLYMSNSDSDIAGYKVLTYTADLSETTRTITANNSTARGEAYLFDLPIGVDKINAGTWEFGYWRSVDSILSESFKQIEIFVRNTDGSETAIATFESASIEDTVLTEKMVSRTNATTVVVNPLGRLGVRSKFRTTRTSNVTLSYIIGDGRGWWMKAPIPMRHDSLRDKNGNLQYQHLNSETEKTTPIGSDSIGLWDSVNLEFVTTTLDNFKNYIANYFVQQEAGKGLSTNDLTNTLKANYDAAYTHSQTDYSKTEIDNKLNDLQKLIYAGL